MKGNVDADMVLQALLDYEKYDQTLIVSSDGDFYSLVRHLYDNGVPVDFDESEVSASIRDQRETQIELSLGEGEASARFWTSDLTVEYVRFNSEYTT